MGATLEKLRLGNVTIPVIYEQDTTLPIVSMQVIFTNSGSIDDQKNYGIAKLTSMIYNEGSKTRGAVGFAKALDDKAIHLGASCGLETFVLDISSLKEQWAESLSLSAELLANPNFTKSTLEKVKTLTLGTIAQKESDFDDVADNTLKAILFPKTPLAIPTRGTKQSVQALTLDDLKTYSLHHLVRSRAIIIIGGDITKEKALESVSQVLTPLPEGQPAQIVNYTASSTQTTQIVKKKTQQAYIYFGAPFTLKAGDAESYKAKVAAFILGSSGFGSRLMEEVRVKRGLAYSAYARIHQNRSASYLSGYLQTKIDNQQQAINLVKSVIGEFIAHGATQKELDGAKKFLLGSEPLRNETLSARLSRTYNEYYLGLPFGHSKDELSKIEALTLDDLNSFIRAHPEIQDLSVAIVTQ